MWAHYANNHQGFCLGFDASGENHGKQLFRKMQYVQHLDPIDLAVKSDEDYNKEGVDYASITKSSHCAYEREWRLWVSLNKEEQRRKQLSKKAIFYVNFNENLVLREVILGIRSTYDLKKLERFILPSDRIDFIKAQKSSRAFEVIPMT